MSTCVNVSVTRSSVENAGLQRLRYNLVPDPPPPLWDAAPPQLDRALNSALSVPPHCQATTLGKLFTPMCLCRSQWSSGNMPYFSVR